jgi:hypothetical protein
MMLPEATYFCLTERDGSPAQSWSLVDCSAGGGAIVTLRFAVGFAEVLGFSAVTPDDRRGPGWS